MKSPGNEALSAESLSVESPSVEVTAAQVAGRLRVPGPQDDKYSRGVVSFVTGSARYPGAAVLGVAGALGAGAGMVRYLGSSPGLVLGRFPEVVCHPGRAQAAVVGSGWATDLWQEAAGTRAPVGVLDAGAMSFPSLRGGFDFCVFTPHAGEAAELLGCSRSEVESAPREAATELARQLGAVVALKGATTWIVGREVRSVTSQSHWAATAGSGDVLAGVIGTVMAGVVTDDAPGGALDERELEWAVAAGVWVHARAARSDRPVTALQIAERVPAVIGDLVGGL